jgi:nucleoside 2-deoxyribosyltransferase
MNQSKVYLAGAMSAFYNSGEYHKATEWREYAKRVLTEADIAIFDPTDNSQKHFTYPSSLNEGVILQNYTYIKKCDIILVNIEKLDDSIGSIWELSAAWIEHKPVIGFGKCDKWMDRPHFQGLVPVVLDTVEDACDYIISMYNQKI